MTVAVATPSNRLGMTGCIVGLLALFAAVLPVWVLPVFFPPPPIEQVIVDTGQRLKDRIVARAKGEQYKPVKAAVHDPLSQGLTVASVALGLLAIALAVFAMFRREERRFAGTAVALGVGAIAFQVILIAIAVALVAAIAYAVLANG
jgi:hypothetical protein